MLAYPFDLFVIKYDDDTPIVTVTVKVPNQQDWVNPDDQEFTVYDLKQEIYKQCKWTSD